MKPLWLQTPAQLSNHLRSFRKARGLTQAALGELIGLDQTRIAKIERDPRLVSVGQLLKLLAVLPVRGLLEPATPKPPSSVGERKTDWHRLHGLRDRLDDRRGGRGAGNNPGR